MNGTILQGDALDVLMRLPDNSVHCCVTSPPYWGLRDYGVAGQLGIEETPGQYVEDLTVIFDQVRRVLRDDGVAWLNLGDSYANDGKWGGSTGGKHAANLHGSTGIGRAKVNTGLKPKDLIGIPWRVAFALQDAGWWLRSDVIWHKPNPMPESVTDRPTKAHEYVFMLTKSARYFYDAAAAEPATDEEYRTVGKIRPSLDAHFVSDPEKGRTKAGLSNQAGGRSTRNKRSVWTIATEPSSVPHYAMMPTALAEVCILAGTSARGVCPACGAPWVRVVEREFVGEYNKQAGEDQRTRANTMSGGTKKVTLGRTNDVHKSSIGWAPGCACDAGDPIPATVLDPFAGTGTTIRVAVGLGRAGIGIELNPDSVMWANRLLAQTQPAMFSQDGAGAVGAVGDSGAVQPALIDL